MRPARSLRAVENALIRVARKIAPKSGKRMTRGELEAALAAVQVLTVSVTRLRGDLPARELGFDTVGGDTIDVDSDDSADVDHGLDVAVEHHDSDDTEFRRRSAPPRGRIGF